MKRKDFSFRHMDGRAFAVDNHGLKVFRMFSDHIYPVSDAYLSTTIRLRCREISEEEARRTSGFKGDLETKLRAAA